MRKPLSFRLMATCFALVYFPGLGLLLRVNGSTLDGVEIAFRLATVVMLVLSGFVIVGLWRAEAWVGRAMDLWVGALAAIMVVPLVIAPDLAMAPLVWGVGVIVLGFLYLPVLYVKDRLHSYQAQALPPP